MSNENTPTLTRVNGKAFFRGAELPAGPWHDEPDHVDFRSPEGIACILHRFNGHWTESYKTLSYARGQTLALAAQAHAAVVR